MYISSFTIILWIWTKILWQRCSGERKAVLCNLVGQLGTLCVWPPENDSQQRNSSVSHTCTRMSLKLLSLDGLWTLSGAFTHYWQRYLLFGNRKNLLCWRILQWRHFDIAYTQIPIPNLGSIKTTHIRAEGWMERCSEKEKNENTIQFGIRFQIYNSMFPRTRRCCCCCCWYFDWAVFADTVYLHSLSSLDIIIAAMASIETLIKCCAVRTAVTIIIITSSSNVVPHCCFEHHSHYFVCSFCSSQLKVHTMNTLDLRSKRISHQMFWLLLFMGAVRWAAAVRDHTLRCFIENLGINFRQNIFLFYF